MPHAIPRVPVPGSAPARAPSSSNASRKTARFAEPESSDVPSSRVTRSSSQSHRRTRSTDPRPAQYDEYFSSSKRDRYHPPATYTVATPSAKYYIHFPPRSHSPSDHGHGHPYEHGHGYGHGHGHEAPRRSASAHHDHSRSSEHRSARLHRSSSQSQENAPAQYRVDNGVYGSTKYRPAQDLSARRTRSNVVVVSSKVSFAERLRRLFGLGPKEPQSPVKPKSSSGRTRSASVSKGMSTHRSQRMQPLVRTGTR